MAEQDKCPRCGAGDPHHYPRRAVGFACGTCVYQDGQIIESESCLRRQLAAMTAQWCEKWKASVDTCSSYVGKLVEAEKERDEARADRDRLAGIVERLQKIATTAIAITGWLQHTGMDMMVEPSRLIAFNKALADYTSFQKAAEAAKEGKK